MPAKVGIIGGGNVGQTLGRQLLKSGRTVVFGSRHPKKLVGVLNEQNLDAEALTVSQAVEKSDVIILAVPGWRDAAGVAALVKSLGPGVSGKVVVDATNPLTDFPALEVLWNGTSGGELLAAALPGASVYKAFNTMGTSVMESVGDMGYSVHMLYAGPPEAGPKGLMESLISDAGFEPKFIGPIRYARNLEALAEMWIHLGVPPAGFTKQSYGNLFTFQLQCKGQP